MKTIKKIAFILLSMLLISNLALATDKEDIAKGKSALKELKAKAKEFRKIMRKASVRSALSGSDSYAKGLTDSDNDGLPDLFEDAIGSSSCDSDTDDDGIDDHHEGMSGSKPDDSQSGEIELKSTVSAVTDTTITVDSKVFTVFTGTEFKDGTSLSSYKAGDFVEIKGKIINGVLTLIKIAKDN